MKPVEYQRGDVTVSTDPAWLDLDVIYDFLTRSYWAEGIPRDVVARSIQNSLCFGVFEGSQQIGFARVITDYATYAYLADVFIVDARRGQGLAKFLMQCVMEHPQLQGLRRWTLATRDAHGLYTKFGFSPLHHPERFMELHNPDVHKNPRALGD